VLLGFLDIIDFFLSLRRVQSSQSCLVFSGVLLHRPNLGLREMVRDVVAIYVAIFVVVPWFCPVTNIVEASAPFADSDGTVLVLVECLEFILDEIRWNLMLLQQRED